MNSNDCSICFEAITTGTGQTTLGCGHAYHIGCITSWFHTSSQIGGDAACPCCRTVVEWTPIIVPTNIESQEVAKIQRKYNLLYISFMVMVFLFTLLLNPVKNVQLFFWALGYLIDPKILTCHCQQAF
jgi:hypothetical protein